jgi:hypothetical protein
MCCYLSLLPSVKVNSCDAMADMLKGLVTRYEAKNKDSGRKQARILICRVDLVFRVLLIRTRMCLPKFLRSNPENGKQKLGLH